MLLCALLALMHVDAGATGATYFEAPESLGMLSVGDRIYADPAMASDQVATLQGLVAKARQRVEHYYGDLIAKPNIVFCASMSCYSEFGAVGLGFTDGNHLVISPTGQRIAIIAHELAHVELTARVGSFPKVLTRVPQWFDEGQAVMASMAEEFSDEAWNAKTQGGMYAPSLLALASMDDWNRLTGPAGENMQMTYGTAKREVSRWYAVSGKSGLRTLLEALRRDEPFAEAYQRIERGGRLQLASEAGGRPEATPAGQPALLVQPDSGRFEPRPQQ